MKSLIFRFGMMWPPLWLAQPATINYNASEPGDICEKVIAG